MSSESVREDIEKSREACLCTIRAKGALWCAFWLLSEIWCLVLETKASSRTTAAVAEATLHLAVLDACETRISLSLRYDSLRDECREFCLFPRKMLRVHFCLEVCSTDPFCRREFLERLPLRPCLLHFVERSPEKVGLRLEHLRGMFRYIGGNPCGHRRRDGACVGLRERKLSTECPRAEDRQDRESGEFLFVVHRFFSIN